MSNQLENLERYFLFSYEYRQLCPTRAERLDTVERGFQPMMDDPSVHPKIKHRILPIITSFQKEGVINV